MSALGERFPRGQQDVGQENVATPRDLLSFSSLNSDWLMILSAIPSLFVLLILINILAPLLIVLFLAPCKQAYANNR